jgi:hypothetical protein
VAPCSGAGQQAITKSPPVIVFTAGLFSRGLSAIALNVVRSFFV